MSKSDDKTTDMSVITETKDLEALLHILKILNILMKIRSYQWDVVKGGIVSALTAARLKDKIFKLILFYPALCLHEDAKKGKMMFSKFDPNNIPDIINCGPTKLGRIYVENVINVDIYYNKDILIAH